MLFESPQSGTPVARVPLSGKCRVVAEGETEMRITAESDSVVLNAESNAEQKDWVRAISAAIASEERLASENEMQKEGETAKKKSEKSNDFELRGWLKKAGPKGTGWKRRWFILNGNLLVYFKGPNDAVPQGEIQIDAARIRSVDATRFNIEVETRIFFLQANSEREKNDWISTLNAARVHFVKLLASESIAAISQEALNANSNVKDSSNANSNSNVSNLTTLVMPPSFAPMAPGGQLSPRMTEFSPNGNGMGSVASAAASNSGATRTEIWDIESKAIIKEGLLSKQGGQIKTWKQRWFVLRGHHLYYYKNAADKEPLGVIPLANSKITITEKSSFEVLTGRRNFFLRGNNKTEADAWITAMERASLAVSTVDKVQVIEEDEPSLLVSSSLVSCEGYLLKEGGKGAMKKWQQRYFVLQGPMLSYFKERGDEEAAGAIAIGSCSVGLAEAKIGKKNSFEIATRYRNYFLVAKDEFEAAKWMQHIEQAKKTNSTTEESPNMELFFRLNDVLAEMEK